MGELLIVSREEVAAHLDYRTCIALMREAMAALSAGGTRQSLRTIIDLAGGRAFGVMPGAMDGGAFGAKLISVFPAATDGTPSHQGVVTLFDPANGAPVAILDAAELTAIRTAAASAAATGHIGHGRAGIPPCRSHGRGPRARCGGDLGAIRRESGSAAIGSRREARV